MKLSFSIQSCRGDVSMRFLSPKLVRIYTKKVINVVPFDYMRYMLHVAHSFQFRPVQSRTILSCVRANRSDFRYSLEMKMQIFFLWRFFSPFSIFHFHCECMNQILRIEFNGHFSSFRFMNNNWFSSIVLPNFEMHVFKL